MVVGRHGDPMDHAAKAVVQECNINIGNARTQHQNMVENDVQDIIRCLVTATQEYVQLMVTGLHGVVLECAPRLVEEA